MILYAKLIGSIVGITLYPFVFLDPEVKKWTIYHERIKNHERIHLRQWTDLMVVSFAIQALLYFGFGVYSFWWLTLAGYGSRYLWYLIEWLVRFLRYLLEGERFVEAWDNAYLDISLEEEAYMHDSDPLYLSKRKPFAWLRYLRGPKKIPDDLL
jgi:hypothetical protein